MASGVATAVVPARLAAATAGSAAGTTLISAPVAALVRSSLRAMSAGPLKIVGAILLAVTLLGAALWGYGATVPPAGETAKPATPPAKEAPKPPGDARPAAAEKHDFTVAGRVLDADGKPLPGARVSVIDLVQRPFRGHIGTRE